MKSVIWLRKSGHGVPHAPVAAARIKAPQMPDATTNLDALPARAAAKATPIMPPPRHPKNLS